MTDTAIAPDALPAAFAAAGDLDAVNALLPQAGVGPGWAKPKPSVYPQPNRIFVPAHWRAADTRAALDSASRYVDTHMSERRNLIMVNPHPGNDYATARTLVAAYQLVLAGETARSHRHTPNALRLVLDAEPGAYTIVDGNSIPMAPGDVLLTPNWKWHGHDNRASSNAFWIDFLDVPFIHLIEPMFFEQFADWIEPAGDPQPDSPFRFAFAQTGPAVRAMAETRPGERLMELGPPHMTTIGLHLRHLSAGAALHDPRTTMNAIYAVIEGTGSMAAEGKRFSFSRGDVLVVPAWSASDWIADSDVTLLRVSDEPMLKMLGLLRSEQPD
ncbi:cupin domain-containing protein [Sphingobium sp. HBC34]|uniref:Cupin domain-containing protein n=1 Tax=Sphingobium cyanobacteriorum TaxID=3063954 RepID=A0ABT8ZPB3_9SPHN|nr:cupin domain-containing protein [Sphingobium sp. HBC34]MDO7836360.1 cupin domain-containing protein [Sphingobium sp. HBC34]